MGKLLTTASYLEINSFGLNLIEIWRLTFTVFLVWLALVFSIIISRRAKQIKLRRATRIRRLARAYLNIELFEDPTRLSPAEKRAQSNFVKYRLRSSKNRKIFLKELIDFKKSFTGEASEKIKRIYVKFGFNQYSFKKTFNFSYLKVIEGLQELSIMEDTNSISLTKKFINVPNTYVRKEAQISIISSRGYEGLSIFNDFEKDLATWQQIRIINVLGPFNKPEKFEHPKLLENPNPDIILLALRIINNFKFYDGIDRAVSFRHHPDVKIRTEVAIILKNFYNPSYNHLLCGWFEKEDNQEVKLYLLEATANLEAIEMLPVLVRYMNEFPDKRIGIASAMAYKHFYNSNKDIGHTRAALNCVALELLENAQNDLKPVN